MPTIKIIGAGLAGSEAALFLAKKGHEIHLYEMRPETGTGAHLTGDPAELVCSNSFKSLLPHNAEGRMKIELAQLGCNLLPIAQKVSVPGGSALTVDRVLFSQAVKQALESEKNIIFHREKVDEFDPDSPCLVATGPLTEAKLFQFLQDSLFDGELYFFDAIAPILTRESLDESQGFWGARYEQGEGEDEGHFFNALMDKETYESFVNELVHAERVPLHDFEEGKLFERCLPVEQLAERGPETLRFGPLSPKGLRDPETDKRPYAAVQLRREDEAGEFLNIVGFQTRLKYKEQQRVFSLIPALKSVHFERLGQMHRNTFVNGPKFLSPDLSHREKPLLFFAGQITGLEGYTSAIASGLVAAINLDRKLSGLDSLVFPKETALGALLGHTQTTNTPYQPSSLNYSLFPPLPEKVRGGKLARREAHSIRAEKIFSDFLQQHKIPSLNGTPS